MSHVKQIMHQKILHIFPLSINKVVVGITKQNKCKNAHIFPMIIIFLIVACGKES